MAYLGEEIKKLGFGLMRLPQKDGRIDIEQTKTMVDMFMSDGFTYFDTAWAYGGSEDATRQALVERYPRESFKLASKIAPWINCKTREEAIAQFDTSLSRTAAGYFDFYLLHNLGENRTKYFDDFGIWDFVKEKKAEGLIKHIGCSAHCTAKELEAILSAHPEIEFVQLQINYADWEDARVQSRAVYEVARSHGKPVIIMEPVKGGLLANPPDGVAKVLKNADPEASFASWAIRFAASLDGVITVLSGMSNIAQMKDNLSYMKDFSGLTKSQMNVIQDAREELRKIPTIPCTSCGYCTKVCPMNIGIPGTFTAMNFLTLYGNLETARGRERWINGQGGFRSADICIKCGACEDACPQHISIRHELSCCLEALKQDK